MAAATAADSSTTATTTIADQDEAVVVKTNNKPLHRAIQLATTISCRLKKPSTASTTSSSTKTTIGEHGVDYFVVCIKLILVPSMFIAIAAISTYHELRDADANKVISGSGFVFVAVQVLPHVYLAVVMAAGGHLDLFAPRTPYAAWEALYKVGFEGMGPPVIITSLGAMVLYLLMLDKAWLLLVACAYLLGLLVAATIAFWLCLLRTYGGNGERRQESSCGDSGGEAIVDGLAYLYSRILYEYAVRFVPCRCRHAAA